MRCGALLVLMAAVLAPASAQAQLEDRAIYTLTQLDLLELRSGSGADETRWDGYAWIGRDYEKLWLKSEGELDGDADGTAEAQALYARLVAPFWFLQAGLRYEVQRSDSAEHARTFAVFGVQGLAPYRVELEPALFLSDDGDASARLTATYDLLLTQRLVSQVRLDTNAASSSAERFGVGRGINDVALALRLRYEFRREFAPYLGILWQEKLGDTADLARRNGEDVRSLSVVAGVRFWF